MRILMLRCLRDVFRCAMVILRHGCMLSLVLAPPAMMEVSDT